MLEQNIQLGYLENGNIALLSDNAFEHEVKRVEYYRDQKLLMLVYNNPENSDDLLHYELDEEAAHKVDVARNVLIYSDDGRTEPKGYYAYLIKVGTL